MNRLEVIDLIRELASNNGSYGRLLKSIECADDQFREKWFDQFADCESCFDVVKKLEGW